MKILLIDTCGASGSIALAGAAPSPAALSLPGRSAAERLVPAIQSLVAGLGLSLAELDAVAVVHGPGSFTGERVGLSAAKGLCHALNLPLVAISRLAVLASLAQPPAGVPHPSQSHRDPGSLTASLAGWGGWVVHALLDAGRGEFYSGLYANGLCLRESLQPRDQLLAEAGREPQQLFVVCEPAVAQSIAELAPQLVAEPTAASALPLALARIQQRAFDDPATIDANYLRRTDAEIFAKSIAVAAPPLSATQPGTPARPPARNARQPASPMTSPPVHLRPAIASDLEAILTLERATDLAPHWPPSVYAAILESAIPQRCLFVAEKDNSLAGFAVGLLHPAASERIAELESVVVSASARRAGIGRALCRAVFDWSRSQGATELILEVRASSSAAIALYAGLGFTLAARRPRYYRDPNDDALLMRLLLEREKGEQPNWPTAESSRDCAAATVPVN